MANYQDEIDAAYAALETVSSVDVPPPPKWNKESTLVFVGQVVRKILQQKLKDDDDIFQHGGDRFELTP